MTKKTVWVHLRKKGVVHLSLVSSILPQHGINCSLGSWLSLGGNWFGSKALPTRYGLMKWIISVSFAEGVWNLEINPSIIIIIIFLMGRPSFY